MKFSLSWLKTHLDTDASLQKITDTLTAIGLELEGVEDRGATLAAFRRRQFLLHQFLLIFSFILISSSAFLSRISALNLLT